MVTDKRTCQISLRRKVVICYDCNVWYDYRLLLCSLLTAVARQTFLYLRGFHGQNLMTHLIQESFSLVQLHAAYKDAKAAGNKGVKALCLILMLLCCWL